MQTYDLKTDATCKVFSKHKEIIEKIVEILEKDYIVTHSPEIQWNEAHEDYEVWLHLLDKDSLEKTSGDHK